MLVFSVGFAGSYIEILLLEKLKMKGEKRILKNNLAAGQPFVIFLRLYNRWLI